MTKRWTQRPEGSTWGDWGDDDELGRINLITPEKVLQGVAEVQAGVSFCLSLPLDFPGWHRAEPATPTAPPRTDRGPRRQPRGVLQHPHERHGPALRRRVGRRRRDPLAAVLDPVGLARPRRCRCSTSTATVSRQAVYYNGYRAHEDIVGPRPDAAGDGCGHASFGKHLGLEHMAYHGVQGRGVLVDIAHHVGHEWRGIDLKTLQEIMDADNVVVEPGDMLLLHTGFATEVLGWNKEPRPAQDLHDVQLPRRARRRAARLDRRLADLRARRRQLRRRGARRLPRTPTPSVTRSCRSTTSACSGSASRSANSGTCTSWRRGCASTTAAGSC